MMFGPEMEVSSLHDVPRPTTGQVKERAFAVAREAVEFIRSNVFPVHRIRG
jgi:hypothetical protein